jgi:peptide deformylase
MILPIYAYGQPVLKKKAVDVDLKDANLPALIANMWETMYHAKGVGLAAPQVGKAIRLFIVDTEQLEDEEKAGDGIKYVFINARKIEEKGKWWDYEEGCLSIPNVRADVERKDTITLEYYDQHFVQQKKTFTGINARVIQHEYDHIDGILFTDHIKPLKRRLINRKLESIRRGRVDADYTLKFIRTK